MVAVAAGCSATARPEGLRHLGFNRAAQIHSDRKNGGRQERLSRVCALSCQLLAKTVIPGEAFCPPVRPHSGFRRSDHPLGCHGGWEDSTTSMMVNDSLISDL